jgi:hypothetical protein
MQGTPHNVDDVPPERENKPTPGAEETNPERQGGPDPSPPDTPIEDEEGAGQGKGPPPESIPGDEGDVPNPKQ